MFHVREVPQLYKRRRMIFSPNTLKFPPVSPPFNRNSSNNMCSALTPPDVKISPDVRGLEMSPSDIDRNIKFDWKGKNGHKKILIIGGASHGKSNFINALHNYFNKKFLSEMEVVIPTKYLQSIEDSPCGTENPNPMNSTDSVTQRCTEYTFTKPFSRNTSITFIDTPGLTDGTRCSAQDKISMDKIMNNVPECEHDEPITGIIIIMKGNPNKDISSIICRAHSHIPFDIKENNSFYIDNPVFLVDVASGLIDDAEKRAYEELYDETMIKIGKMVQSSSSFKNRMISPTTVITPSSSPPPLPPHPPSSWLSNETVEKDHMKLPDKDLKNNDKTVTMDNHNNSLRGLFKHLTTKTFINFQRMNVISIQY
eukprot:gene6123-12398_t